MAVIPDRPNINFQLAFLGYGVPFSVSLRESVREALSPGEQLTNEVALRVLTQIAAFSSVKAFMTQRVVAIPLSVAVLVTGFIIPMEPLLVNIIGLLVCFIGGALVGLSFQGDFLPQLSQAYRTQAEEARLLIGQLAADPELNLQLA